MARGEEIWPRINRLVLMEAARRQEAPVARYGCTSR